MSEFERKFIIKCLDKLPSILSSKTILTTAIKTFTRNNLNNTPYQLNIKIADYIQWSVQERRDFTSAYSEALKQTIESFSTKIALTPVKEMEHVKKLLEKKYIWELTSGTRPEERILSVMEHIERLFKTEFITTRLSTDRTAGNPYYFFSLVAVDVTITAAAIVLTREPYRRTTRQVLNSWRAILIKNHYQLRLNSTDGHKPRP